MHALIARSVEQQEKQRSADKPGGASEQRAANIWGRIGRGHRPLYKVPALDAQCRSGVRIAPGIRGVIAYTGCIYSTAIMNAPLSPEVLRLREESQQEALLLLPEGVQRYVWEGRFGAMLIEVID